MEPQTIISPSRVSPTDELFEAAISLNLQKWKNLFFKIHAWNWFLVNSDVSGKDWNNSLRI